MEAALKTEYTKEFQLHEKDTGSAMCRSPS